MSPRMPARTHEGTERVALPPGYDFKAATRKALRLAEEGEPCARVLFLLRTLADVGTDLLDRVLAGELSTGQIAAISRAEKVGASYKQLAFVAHLAGFSEQKRYQFYRLAEDIGLSQRHAGQLVRALKRSRSVGSKFSR